MRVQAFMNVMTVMIDSSDPLRTQLFDLSPCYVYSRLSRGHAEIYHKSYGYILQTTAAPFGTSLIPGHKSPKEYLQSLMQASLEGHPLTQVTKPYAEALVKTGRYKAEPRMWGDHDFVYAADYIACLSGRRAICRRARQLLIAGCEVRNPRKLNLDKAIKLYGKWKEEYDRQEHKEQGVSRPVDEMIEGVSLPGKVAKAVDLKILEVWMKRDLVGYGVACRLSKTYWCFAFSHVSHHYSGADLLMMQEFCNLYEGVPYIADGTGGGAGTGLWNYKRQFVSDNVVSLQKLIRTVKLKG